MTTWFITGASRGFGAEIARVALAAGDDVVAAVRDVTRLPEDLAEAERLLPVALDVTDVHAIPTAVDAAVSRFGTIDVLVNNAGRGLLGAVEEVSDTEIRDLFELNVFGVINVTRAVLPVMRRQGRGKLVHMGSRAGFEGEPGTGIYNASKFAVAGLSEALAAELAPFGIQSMVVEPGVFRTDFLDSSSLSLPADRITAYDALPPTPPSTGPTRATTPSSAIPSRARPSSTRSSPDRTFPGTCTWAATPSNTGKPPRGRSRRTSPLGVRSPSPPLATTPPEAGPATAPRAPEAVCDVGRTRRGPPSGRRRTPPWPKRPTPPHGIRWRSCPAR
ncbi:MULTISPECIES: SDR family NAD(P)-dependent oxidoreductase [unclassified Streptomyces]|uniref:SDR family NAD(P)-dependent oxidoreductase n=1 Tax=unclassified Streptomyces TaxID=2593676 RepID=UPI0003A73272|nr:MULTISPECIES: SDR family NAD(P)-dependent oxidoreductase [unclassified Streptomyces]